MAGDGIPGSGQFEGMIWDGNRWVVRDSGSEPAPIGKGIESVESSPTTRPMSRRDSGGMAMLAAVGIGLLGVTWIRGYDDLVARFDQYEGGNQYARWTIVFGICALAIAVVVGFWGALRWSNRARSLAARVVAPLAPIRKQVNDGRRRLRDERTAEEQRHLEQQWWKAREHGESGGQGT